MRLKDIIIGIAAEFIIIGIGYYLCYSSVSPLITYLDTETLKLANYPQDISNSFSLGMFLVWILLFNLPILYIFARAQKKSRVVDDVETIHLEDMKLWGGNDEY